MNPNDDEHTRVTLPLSMQKQVEARDNERRTFIHDVRHRVKAAEEPQGRKHGIQQKETEREGRTDKKCCS